MNMLNAKKKKKLQQSYASLKAWNDYECVSWRIWLWSQYDEARQS